MLLKNLSSAELLYIMPLRFILDSTAALHALTKGEFRTSSTIFRAQLTFFAGLPTYLKSRKKNLKTIDNNRISTANINGIYTSSVVWAHFVKKIKKFSHL